jgi:hypothetical protein
MPTTILGVTTSADAARLVLLTKQDNGDFTLDDQTTMNVQPGGRPAAYDTIHGQFMDYAKQRAVQCVCIKGSAVSLMGTKLVHLQAAELRGVLQAAAAAAGTEVRLTTKAAVSRNFGSRKVDDYLKDDNYWTGLSLTQLKKGMREAAFVAISEFAN